MTSKKLKELRELSDAELLKQQSEIEKKMMSLRFKAKIEKIDNPMEKRNARRTVAVINTLLAERRSKSK